MTRSAILVVDDDVAMREAVGASLASEGYEVRFAETGEMALSAAAAVRPDLILLDVVMPGIDGYATLDILRQDPDLCDIPVIFVSCMAAPEPRTRAIEMGADDFVVKPFHWPELLARIRRVLNRTRSASVQMSGRLDDVSLPELLQTLDLGRKAARIWLRDIGGEIVVSAGGLVEARWYSFRGVAALERLLLVARGGYAVRFGETTHASIDATASLATLLLQLTTRSDETLRDLSRLIEPDARIRVARDWPSGHVFASLRDVASVRASEALALLPGEPQQNIQALAAALDEGGLELVGDGHVIANGDGEGPNGC